MKKNEIKKTVEEVVRVEYIAEDGKVFWDEAECRKYEESALFAVSERLKRLNHKYTSMYDLTESGSEEDEVEIFDIQTPEDLENLRRYLYLTMTQNRATETMIKDCFTGDGVTRVNLVFDNVTVGHEVLIFWGYDKDWFWVHNDGSLAGYFSWLKDNYTKIITPKETN